VVDQRRREAARAMRCRHRPARPGDPVHRGLSTYLERLWNTGSPAFAGDDDLGGSSTQRSRRRNIQLSSPGSTGRPSTPRHLDSSRTPLNTGSPAFAEDDNLGGSSTQRSRRQHTIVIARLDRATQYAAASRFHLGRLWNTGSPAFAEDGNFCSEPPRLKRRHP